MKRMIARRSAFVGRPVPSARPVCLALYLDTAFPFSDLFVKSSNRILDSLNFGKFVIKSKTSYHTELDQYCFVGNIGEGINWYFDNYDIAIEKVKNGKKFEN